MQNLEKNIKIYNKNVENLQKNVENLPKKGVHIILKVINLEIGEHSNFSSCSNLFSRIDTIGAV